jgi:ribosomal-protein-alanine N-acetyltransferase
MSVQIFPLSEEHIDDICAIENESFGDPWNRQFFLELLDNPFAVAFAACERFVAGYLIAYHVGAEIQILNIAVRKDMRNKNIATKLFGVIFDYAKTKEIGEFTLEVRPSNSSAIALYKKLGFEKDGIRKNYYRNPSEDAILMSLRGI